MPDTASRMPHRNLYTRLKVSSKGVGVFSIREIPKGTRLFAGDLGETVRVPVADVTRIADVELRRMYTDFCPVIKGCFIAPADFNQMTMGWYMNHSEEPNVTIFQDLQFVTSRRVLIGEELTTDYTTYSEHAQTYGRTWPRPWPL
jgi:uncharacterized protein